MSSIADQHGGQLPRVKRSAASAGEADAFHDVGDELAACPQEFAGSRARSRGAAGVQQDRRAVSSKSSDPMAGEELKMPPGGLRYVVGQHGGDEPVPAVEVLA